MKRAARFRPFFAAHPVRNAKAGVLTKLFAARAACGNFQGRPNFAGKRALGDFFCTRSGEYFYPPLPHRRLPPRRELLGGRLVAGGRAVSALGAKKSERLSGTATPVMAGAAHPYCLSLAAGGSIGRKNGAMPLQGSFRPLPRGGIFQFARACGGSFYKWEIFR